MKKLLLPLVILALLLGATDARAQPKGRSMPAKPVVVISFAGYEALMGDIKFVGKLADTPELAGTVELVLRLVTSGRGLVGLDKSRPWGAVILPKGDDFTAYGFLPVTNLDKVLGVIKPVVQGIDELDGGVFKIQGEDGQVVYVKEKGGWAFITDDSGMFAKLPADPVKALGGLNKQYDLAVRFHVANIPVALRDETLQEMKTAMTEGLREELDVSESEVLKKAADGFSKNTFEFFKSLAEEMDHITLGWTLDQKAEKAIVDVVVVAKEGTELARSAGALEKMTSDFGAFAGADAAMSARITGTAPKSKIAALKSLVEIFRAAAIEQAQQEAESEAEKKLADKLLGNFCDVLEKTIESNRFDGAGSMIIKKKSATVIGGGYVADGYALDAIMKDVIKIAKESGEEGVDQLKLDVEKFKGVRLHTMPIPFDDIDEEQTKKIFGESPEAVVGYGKKSMYFAIGTDSLETLKRAIRDSAKQSSEVVPPLRVSVSVQSMARFVSKVAEPKSDRREAAKVAKILAESPGQDHVTVTATPIANGVHYRLEVEPGLLRLFGKMVADAQAGEEPSADKEAK